MTHYDLCGSPHPDAKYRAVRRVQEVIPGTKVTAMPQGVLREVIKEFALVTCSRVAGHEQRGDMTCRGFAFSIKTPDEWPIPPRSEVWPQEIGTRALPGVPV